MTRFAGLLVVAAIAGATAMPASGHERLVWLALLVPAALLTAQAPARAGETRVLTRGDAHGRVLYRLEQRLGRRARRHAAMNRAQPDPMLDIGLPHETRLRHAVIRRATEAQARERRVPGAVALVMAANAIAVAAAARGLASPAEGPVGSSEPAPTRVAASPSGAAAPNDPVIDRCATTGTLTPPGGASVPTLGFVLRGASVDCSDVRGHATLPGAVPDTGTHRAAACGARCTRSSGVTGP
jgi:hypothetical protein